MNQESVGVRFPIESEQVAETLKANGLKTELLVFREEGHDVIKHCCTRKFFKQRLKP
jgi:dipeptidyl aminopeptidase/acylaminoacyl peptidase